MKLLRLKKQKRTALIIKDHVIRYVESKEPSIDQIKKYAERYLPFGIVQHGNIVDRETLLMILDECIDTWKINRREIQFCVPDSNVVIRNISIRKTVEREELNNYLFMEIGESIHLPFEDPIFDYRVFDEDDDNYYLLLIASREETIQTYNELFQELKLRPNAADILPLAIYRLLFALDKVGDSEHTLLIQVDFTNLNFTVFHRHYPLFSRNFPIDVDQDKVKLETINGQEQLIWVGEEEETEENANNLIREIERIMNYYRFSVQKGKVGITQIAIVGDHSELATMIDFCRGSFDIPIIDLLTLEKEIFPPHYYDVIGLMLKKEVR